MYVCGCSVIPFRFSQSIQLTHFIQPRKRTLQSQAAIAVDCVELAFRMEA